MDSDIECFSCHTHTLVGRAAGSSLLARAALDPNARRNFIVMKWSLSLLGLVIGGVITVAGASAFFNRQANPTTARRVTAGELLRGENPEALSDWVYYDSPKIIDTHVMYAMVRSRQVMSRFYLVQVEDRWLLAHVATEF